MTLGTLDILGFRVRVYAYLECFEVSDSAFPGKIISPEKLPTIDVCGFELTPARLVDFEVENDTAAEFKSMLQQDNYLALKTIEESTNVIPPTDVKNELEALISCMRIYRGGYVGVKFAMLKIPLVDKDHSIDFFIGSSPRDIMGGPIYVISEAEINEFKAFMEQIYPLVLKSISTGEGDLATRFFNRAVEDLVKNDLRMSLVDFMSSLESMLSTSKNEITHRLAQSVSILVEREPVKRLGIYKVFKNLYDKRSKTIHGEGYKKKAMQEMQDAFKLENIVRRCMMIYMGYLTEGKNKADIIHDISEILFGVRNDLPDHAFKFL